MTRNDYVNCENSYTTERFQAHTSLENYFNNYVNIPYFEKYCKECKNYNKSWECPPHNNNIEEYWKSFNDVDLIAIKLNYSEEFRKPKYTTYELNYIIKYTLYHERRELKKELIQLEKEKNGKFLYGGSCDFCKKCSKITNDPCRLPDKMRYSVESIGSNVVKTTKDFFGFELKWIEEDYKLPEYLVTVCAILY